MANEDLIIKTYNYWDLYLDEKQDPYFGSCYARAKKETAKTIPSMLLDESSELFNKVFPEWNKTIKELFRHDFPNLLSNGNPREKLKWYFIPMYESTRKIYGIDIMPQNINGEYVSNIRKGIDGKILLEIRDRIREEILEF